MIIPFKTNKVKVTSAFGNRVLNGEKQFHSGYDLVGVGSHEVICAVPGKVIRSRIITDKNNPTWQWGNYVCVRGSDGYDYYYCHLASRAVTEGQTVKAGDKLGIMGNTGYSFGAHLHFEVRRGSEKINPETVLGIPNKTGTYTAKSELESDLELLTAKGVINTPSYWLRNVAKLEHLYTLIHNFAEYIRKNGV